MTDSEKYFLEYLNSKGKKIRLLVKNVNNVTKKSEYFSVMKNILTEINNIQKLSNTLKISNIYPNDFHNNLLLINNKTREINMELSRYSYEMILENELLVIVNKINNDEVLKKEDYKLIEFYLLYGVIPHTAEETIYNFLLKESLIRENHISYKAFEKVIIFYTKLNMIKSHVSPICQIKTQHQIDEIIRKKAIKKRISIPREQIKDLYYNGNYELLKNLFYDLACIQNYDRIIRNEIDQTFEIELKEEILVNYLPSYYKSNTDKISFIIEAKKYALKALNKLFELLKITFKNLDNPFTKELEKLNSINNDNKRIYKNHNFTVDELFNKLAEIRPEISGYVPKTNIEEL